MPDRGSPTLLRILPLGMAAALLQYLFPPLKARRQQQARGQAIIDSASDAIISIDSRQIILHANAAAARLFGDTPAGMRGMRLGQYILRDLRSLGKHEGDPPFDDISQELRLTGSTDKIDWMVELGGLLHGEMGWVLLACIVGHAVMAFWHRRPGHTDVMPRMMG